MEILVLYDDDSRYAGEIVATALRRSFTAAQVGRACYAAALDASAAPAAAVLVNPPRSAAPLLARLLTAAGKALVLGRVEPPLADLLGLEIFTEPPAAQFAVAQVDHALHHNDSPAGVRYTGHALGQRSPLAARALCRFDFQDEWNNLGYGRITADGGPWSLATAVEPRGCEPIAWLTGMNDNQRLYAALRDGSGGAALWFNRAVGPVDSGEWQVVEAFFCDYRAEELVCFPALSEIPAGYSAAATMRLDCDESIASARPLWELYRDCGFPLSLAAPIGQPIGAADLALLDEVAAGGGGVLSHSVSHAPRWGGSYTAASREARQSKAWLEQHVPRGAPVEFAVSPFHQNPIYAVHALADAGYAGFVGGIIANDPEYLLGRAGQVPFVEMRFVSHSAQCMLHGDCYVRYGNSVDAYRESFDNHARARSLFGYLDHPFSPRYQYGWPHEQARLAAHSQLLQHIGRGADVWRPSLTEALRWLARRNAVSLAAEDGARLQWRADGPAERPAGAPRFEARWKGVSHVH